LLTAGGDDIKYTVQPRPNVEKDLKLSNVIGREATKAITSRIRSVKGYAGGRFYVNEFRTIFAPIEEARQWRYVYVGQLDLASWFSEPHSSASIVKGS
jgi:hypothetical protein